MNESALHRQLFYLRSLFFHTGQHSVTLSDTDLFLSITTLLFYLSMLSNLSLFSACVKSLNDCERSLILTNKTPASTKNNIHRSFNMSMYIVCVWDKKVVWKDISSHCSEKIWFFTWYDLSVSSIGLSTEAFLSIVMSKREVICSMWVTLWATLCVLF